MTQTLATPTSSGLEGIVVAETRLSHVDGERGRLVIGGYDVEDLAARATFEDVVALLFFGSLPDASRRAQVQVELARGRELAFAELDGLGDALALADAMDAVRTSVAHLRLPVANEDAAYPHRAALRLVGALPTFSCAWSRRMHGLEPVSPNVTLSHAADTLRMLLGHEAHPSAVRALDAYLVTVSDHGLNASTFVARVVASTGSDLVSAIVAAIGALKGPLHGGAPGPVLDMLDAIGEASRARAWLEGELAAGRRIMGMGHRIYRVRDPRAHVLERTVEQLGAHEPANARLVLARAVEREAEVLLRHAHADRSLRANVEFYTAVVLEAAGVPRELFAATFAASRASGWCAHVAEQRAFGRLIRPASRYVGDLPSG